MPRPGRKPGTPKTGGRQKGSPNKLTLLAASKLEALGCDPLEGMAKIAMDVKNPVDLRGRMYAELAQYIYPKRKAVEHTGPDGEEIRFRIEDVRAYAQSIPDE